MSDMEIQAVAVVVDHMGAVLLGKDGAGQALTPPRVALQPGQLPGETLATATRGQTGLIVLPLRLTGLFFDGRPAGGKLTIAFRCLLRGGSLAQENGEPRAAFFPITPLPDALSATDRQLLDQALHHSGGPPALETPSLGVAGRLLRRLSGDRDEPAGDWSLRVLSVVPTGDGRVGTLPGYEGAAGQLPGGPVEAGEAPWQAAERLAAGALGREMPVLGLPAVFLAAAAPEMTLVFSHAPTPPTARDTVRWLSPDDDTDALRQPDRAAAQAALQPEPVTVFRVMEKGEEE